MSLFWQWLAVTLIAMGVLYVATYGVLVGVGLDGRQATINGIVTALACFVAALPGGVMAFWHGRGR